MRYRYPIRFIRPFESFNIGTEDAKECLPCYAITNDGKVIAAVVLIPAVIRTDHPVDAEIITNRPLTEPFKLFNERACVGVCEAEPAGEEPFQLTITQVTMLQKAGDEFRRAVVRLNDNIDNWNDTLSEWESKHAQLCEGVRGAQNKLHRQYIALRAIAPKSRETDFSYTAAEIPEFTDRLETMDESTPLANLEDLLLSLAPEKSE